MGSVDTSETTDQNARGTQRGINPRDLLGGPGIPDCPWHPGTILDALQGASRDVPGPGTCRTTSAWETSHTASHSIIGRHVCDGLALLLRGKQVLRPRTPLMDDTNPTAKRGSDQATASPPRGALVS